MRNRNTYYTILVGVLILVASFVLMQKKALPTKEISLTSNKVDENGLYYAEDYVFEEMEPFEEVYIHKLSEKLDETYETLLNPNMKVFYSVIPDKGYFVENPSFTKENYESIINILTSEVEHMEYIPIMDKLSITDYYKTDHHWRQERLFPVVNQLGKYMDFNINKSNFTENIIEEFKGVHSEFFEEIPKESLVYMTSKETQESIVEIYEDGNYEGVYFKDELDSKEPYNIFLKGLSPIVNITNPHASSDKELIVFGDSYSRSIVPLILEAYSKITIIDLRFVPVFYLPELIEFAEQDVLFLYSTSVINRSAMLKF